MPLLFVLAALASQSDLPPNTSVLSVPAPGFRLPDCSRPTAGPVEDGWEVQDSDIAAMETTLGDLLPGLASREGFTAGTEDPDPLTYRRDDERWQREIFGIVRNGRRLIYANFLPSYVTPNRQRMPTNICDGGPAFFGAEYDVASGRITHLAFNGAIGGPFWPVYAP